MKLLTYRLKNKLSQKDLAKILGITPAHLCFIEKGIRRPSPDLALKIDQVTGGAVTRMELLYPQESIAKVNNGNK